MGVAINLNLGGRGQRFEIDVSHLPVIAQRKNGLFAGLFMTVFGLVWGGFPVVGIVSILGAEDQSFEPEMILFFLFPLIGIGIVLFGVHQLLWRKTITLDRESVAVAERGLRGGKAWREPLANYMGVLRRSRQVRTKNSSYTLYIVDLVHEDDSKTINLYTSRSEGGHRAKWESYARALGKPALERGQGGMLRREAEDLDKSIGDLIREGKVDVNVDALSHKAQGLAVDFEGDTVVITRTGPKNPWWGMLIAVTVPLVFVAAAVFVPDMPWMMRILFGGLGALFEAALVIATVWDFVSRQRLRIGPQFVSVGSVSPWGDKQGNQIPVHEIENVTINRESGNRLPAVVIASDRETLKFGSNLPGPSLDFVMNTVLAKIAEFGRRRRR